MQRVPTGVAGEPPARVAVALNIDHHRAFMHDFQVTLWIALAAGALLTALLGFVAARRGLGPVRAMAALTQRVTATRLTDRVPIQSLPAELVDLGAAFNDMLGRLEDSFRRLSEFSSDLAHELRTPIGNLMTETQVALSRARSAEEYREILYANLEELDRLARMTGDMLFLAKAENGLVVPHTETFELATEARQLFEFYDALAEERGVRLELQGEASVDGDRLMVRRALSNLLSNALRHTKRGETVRVLIDNAPAHELRVDHAPADELRIDHAPGDEVRIVVENRGTPIAPEHLARIFDRFFRVDPARQRVSEGAGLGLAITKSIVEAHRGSIDVTSEGGLTRFTIVLPGRRESEMGAGPTRVAERPRAGSRAAD